MSNLEKSKLVYCDKCEGDIKCNYCHGKKYYLEIGNYSVYFDKDFSKDAIFIEQTKSTVNIIFNSILALFGVIGIISLAFHVYKIWSSENYFLLGINWFSSLMLVFWFGILCLMFLFYKLQLSSYIKEKVIKYSFSETKKHRSVNSYNAFSKHTQKLLLDANYLAQTNKNTISSLHIFYKMFDNEDFIIILSRLGVSVDVLKSKVKEIINNLKNDPKENVYFIDTVLNSYFFASLYADENVKINHLLLALSLADQRIFDLFYDLGIDSNQLKNAIAWIKLRYDLSELYKKYKYRSSFKPKNSMNRSMTAIATPLLDRFSSDLTILAKYGYLDLVVARDKKIEEIYRAIETSNKGVILLGNPGCGKDSIIEGLANKMAAEDVPELLRDKRLVSLSLSKFVSEAANGGNIQFLFIKTIEEVARSRNIILVINDIHNVVGVASIGTETIDLSNVLADCITKYSLIVIGTTTELEYKKYLRDNALSTLMNIIQIPPTDFNETVQVLEARSFAIEHKHKVYFSYQAIEKIVKLTDSYIRSIEQPVKAIRIMEEVAIMVKKLKGDSRLVTAEDVAKLISEKVNIPLTKVSVSESEKLLNLEKIIHQRVIGQNEAVNMVASALRRARAELRDENKPITNLLFLGPTGVGKTELAKTVAEIYFNDENNMIRLDMSEYQEKSSIARLIGMEGERGGGVLTEAIKKNPYCLLLLDEIEKAHSDILNVFLQVMDDGRLTDSSGETADFTNCIIIATSNAGAFYIQDKIAENIDLETIKNDLLINQLRHNFKPEFLNRFNGIILFKPLTQKEVQEITSLMLNKIGKKLEEKGIFFSATQDAINELAQTGFSREFGARPLARIIEQTVNDSLANMLLTNKIGRRDKVILDKNGEIKIDRVSRT